MHQNLILRTTSWNSEKQAKNMADILQLVEFFLKDN